MTPLQEDSFICLRSWAKAVEQQNKAAVLQHYAPKATLWPTLSNELRQDADRIGDYFDHFLPKIAGPVDWHQCVYQAIDATHCLWSGAYTFQLTSGATTARFTYMLVLTDGVWRIGHHHSSLMPMT
jgi:hypothetical protein